MSFHTFGEQRVNTFERLRGNGFGAKRLVTETHQLGPKRLGAKRLEGDTTSGGNGLGVKRLEF